jgi:two-component system chemotaxis response regulator CheB
VTLHRNPPGHDIIVVGASAGGVEALTALVKTLPADLEAAVFVVLHFPPQGTSVLPRILARAGPLPAVHAQDGEPILAGRIYVCPPDRHMLLGDGVIRLVRGPRENGHRPSVDPLFRSAALAFGPRVIGLILSGSGDDGTSGLLAVKRMGGLALAQDPDEAFSPGMPASARDYVTLDACPRLAEIGPLLARLAHEPAPPPPHAHADGPTRHGATPGDAEMEIQSAAFDTPTMLANDRPGALAGFTCPECRGPLWELHDEQLVRYRCQTGHAYTSNSLLSEKGQALEAALWAALNSLDESIHLARRMAERLHERNLDLAAGRFEAKVEDMTQHVEVLRSVLLNGESRAYDGTNRGEPELAAGLEDQQEAPQSSIIP